MRSKIATRNFYKKGNSYSLKSQAYSKRGRKVPGNIWEEANCNNYNCSFRSPKKFLTHTYHGVSLSIHILAPTSNKMTT